MYATHTTLIDNESYTFMKRGFDVYTAAWATNSRSRGESPILATNPLHPYKGKCDFLTDEDISVLSKIDIRRGNQVEYNNDVLELLLDKFDVLYVFQVTPWLMLYAKQFLEAGKKVIFRTSGQSLNAWGEPKNYRSLMIYRDFYLLASNPAELTIGAFKDIKKRVITIMISIHPELIDSTSKLENCGKYMFSVGPAPISTEDRVKKLLEPVIEWRLMNRNRGFTSVDEANKLYNSCYFYFDMTTNLFQYSAFEAILHGKAILALKNGAIYKFMKPGVKVGLEYWHNGYEDTKKIKFYLDNPKALARVYQAQRLWLDNLIIDANNKWDKFIEENVND